MQRGYNKCVFIIFVIIKEKSHFIICIITDMSYTNILIQLQVDVNETKEERRHLQTTMKLGCSAKIVVHEIVKILDVKVC